MKILLLADINSEHTERWAIGLASKGFTVGLFSLNSTNFKWWESNKNIVNLRPKLLPNNASKLLTKLAYIKVLPDLKQAIDAFLPDILHAHYASSYGLLGRLSGFRPFIISAWGTDVMRFPQKSWLNKKLLKKNFEKADVIQATSNTIKEYINKLAFDSVKVIPFGVDTAIFKPQENSTLSNEKPFVISTIKSLEKTYCIDIIIMAFSEVVKKYPDNKLRLMIVGEGSELINLKKLVDDLNMTNEVEFTGRIKYADIPHYHNRTDIFVNISEYESFGVSVIEAMACEKPVIVTNQGGLKEIVEDNNCGLLVPIRNVAETINAIEKLLLDQNLRQELGKKGRKLVLEHYNWKDNLQEQVAVYNSLLK